MRDIADSDIEYDLREINTSISVDEAHSNGLARACNNSGDRDCLCIGAAHTRGESCRQIPPISSSPLRAHGAASWQEEGGMQPI